ncbi:ABC transporter-like protein 12 [Dinothrombium tinctorium]|uniref:ABC transporter-like protein 12 n=1 Tax=Dinothrombium tinctorium TaxID=1965070 RepID=A0A3S3PF82_9ACAR|nr:ABC transporter-like protein 12 [Dinothrombium tinctorium]
MEHNAIRVNENHGDLESSNQLNVYSVIWDNVSYTVTNSWFKRKLAYFQGIRNVSKTKQIVQNVSGHFRSGELVAIMGPSGAGKSTLLEAIVGKKFFGREGRIVCTSKSSFLSLAFVPQHDHFHEELTVKESLVYAAKLKLTTKYFQEKLDTSFEQLDLKKMNQNRYNKVVKDLIEKLGLDVCVDNRIPVCSGGQLKRLAIAQELVSKPNILILDEPTSGLDSNTCLMLMQYLRELVDSSASSISIMVTIHQPNYRVFSLFHRVYTLSRHGKCIYEGKPTVLVEYMNRFGLQCPRYYNPAEFLIDIASGDYGEVVLNHLAAAHNEQFMNELNRHEIENAKDLHQFTTNKKCPFFEHLILLTQRSIVLSLRNSWLSGIKLWLNLFLGLFAGFVYGSEVGKRAGCPPKIDEEFDPSQLEMIQAYTKAELDVVADNCGGLFSSLITVIFLNTFVTVLTFPYEMSVVVKEENNNWYTINAYTASKTLSEIPFVILFSSIFPSMIYTLTNQVRNVWRFLSYVAIYILFAFFAQSQGMLIGAVAMNYVTAGVYCAPLTVVPMILFSGFFLRMSDLPIFFRAFPYISIMNYAYEALITILYGFDRCDLKSVKSLIELRNSLTEWFSESLGVNPEKGNYTSTGVTEQFVDRVVKAVSGNYARKDGKVQSLAFNLFERSGDLFYLDVVVLLISIVAMRFVAYFAVRWRIKKRQ